jgi:hypothetical protein
MAKATQRTRVYGNPARYAFGKKKPRPKTHHKKSARRNPGGEIIGFTLGSNPGRKGGHMATAKKKYNKHHSHKSHGGGKKRPYKNPGAKHKTRRYKRNPGAMPGGLSFAVTNAVFVVVGALGSKLGAQAVLGSNNVGLLGYAGNAAAGGILWFLTEKVMRNRAASAGVIAGTLVQIILRIINDYTPFGQYVAQLGMGDYQMQSFVTPQVLVDPWNSAEIAIPPGWGGGNRALPAGNGDMPAVQSGVAGLYGAGGAGSAGNLYAVA